MAPTRATASALRRTARAVDGAGDLAGILAAFAATAGQAVGFDHLCLGEVDPATHLVTSKVDLGGAPADARPVLENEYTEPDVAKFSLLARSTDPVARLGALTDHLPERSPRFRQVLAPLGYSDEARVALGAGGSLWGFLEVLRGEGAPPFSEAEAALLGGAAPILTRGLCRLAGARPVRPDDALPGILMLGPQGQAVSVSSGARGLLDELSPGRRLPPVVEMVYVAARTSAPGHQATARVRCASGRWLTVSATSLTGLQEDLCGEDPPVPAGSPPAGAYPAYVVVLQPTRPEELAPLLFQANGLTDREVEVAEAVWRQLSTDEIARALFVSPYTVQDHLKSIFSKFGVRSRRELVATVLAERMVAPPPAPVTPLRELVIPLRELGPTAGRPPAPPGPTAPRPAPG